MPPAGPPEPVVLIANPAAGPGRRRNRLTALVERAGALLPDLDVWPTDGPGAAALLARRAVEKGYASVLVAGGDGTINEALQGLAGTPACLGPLPLGTANVLCRELGLPLDPMAALERLAAARPRTVTLGRMTGGGTDRHFVLMAGVGLDSAIVADVSEPVKRRLGVGAYFLQAGLTGVRYRFPPIRVTAEAGAWVGTSVVIANARNYAGSFLLAPDAGLGLPDLCMVLFDGRSPVPYLGFAGAVLVRQHTRMPGVTVHRADRFKVEADTPLPVQADGELAARLPLTISAVPGALRLLVPGDFPGGPSPIASTPPRSA